MRTPRQVGSWLAIISALAIGVTFPKNSHGAYIDHPKLLFTTDDIAGLRAKVVDGGPDDVAYSHILQYSNIWLGWAPHDLTSKYYSEGLDPMVQLALVAHMEIDGSAYAQKIRDLAMELVNSGGPDNDEVRSSLRMRTLAIGYDTGFASATSVEQEQVRNEMMSYLQYAQAHFSYYAQQYNPYASNHGMVVGSSMGLVVLALWDDVSAEERPGLAAALSFADALVQKQLDDLLDAGGAHKEGVLYGAYSMRMAIPYFEARVLFDGFDYGANPKIAKMVEWLCYELLPEGLGHTNNLNDSALLTSPLALHGTYLDWIQTRYANPLGNYLYEHTSGTYGIDHGAIADKVAVVLWHQPLAPIFPGSVLPNSKLFMNRGLYYYRSDWKSSATGREILFSFYSGKYYGGHAQEDQNQFTLYAYGDRFAVDAGPVGLSSGPKESASHNLVLIDGLGQHNAGNSIGTDGNIAASFLTPSIDYLRGDAKAAYDTYSPFNAFGVPFPNSDWSWGYDGGNPVDRADRLLLVVKGPTPYLVMADDIVKDGAPHTYQWTLHTNADNTVSVDSNLVTILGQRSALDVCFVTPPLTFGVAPYSHGGPDPATQRLSASLYAVEPRFFTALVPRDSAGLAPVYAPVVGPDLSRLTLEWGTSTDEIAFNPGRALVSEGGLETDGVLALVRSDTVGVCQYALAEGSTLRHASLALVSLTGGAGSVVLDGRTLYLSSEDLDFACYGPSVASVLGPSGPVTFFVNGDYVSAVPTDTEPVPVAVILSQNFPNPFNPCTTLRFEVRQASHVRVQIFDPSGRLVRTLLNTVRSPGWWSVLWDGTDTNGIRQASGTYMARFETSYGTATRKLTLLR